MRRALFFATVVLFLVAVPFAAMAVDQLGKGDTGKGGQAASTPVVVTPDHTQCLGGRFFYAHAWWGLRTAAEHSRVITWGLKAS
jgi:hypothetical protein